MSIALNLQGFPEYFDFTRRVATNKAKITCKSLYLQHSDHSRYDLTDLFRIKSCQLMSRMIALVYNWWNLFVRLAIPEKHHEAITSRPLLLSSIGRLTKSGHQKKMFITSNHGDEKKLQGIYKRLNHFFKQLKAIAPQLTFNLNKSVEPTANVHSTESTRLSRIF